MDIEVPARYLRENFRPDDRLAVVLIQKATHRVVQRIATAEKIAAPGFQAWLRHENAERNEVYVSMNTIKPGSRGRTKDDIAEVRHIYLDFDNNGTAAVQALMQRNDVPTPNYLVNSSGGEMAGGLEGRRFRTGRSRTPHAPSCPRDRRRPDGN